MKKAGKYVMLAVLIITLAVGCYFGVFASGEDDPNGCEKVMQTA